jgi:hypothetical protein
VIAAGTLALDWIGAWPATRLRAVGWEADGVRAPALEAREVLAAAFAVVPSAVVAAASRLEGLQPLAGEFTVEDEALVFTPRFPFVEGREYSVLRQTARGYLTLGTIALELPESEPATEVLAIYPSAPVVPLNLLRMYVQFSAPVREGGVVVGVTLTRDGDGTPLQDVFLPELELWDPERRRLTLLLDPGRIKRGLLPHEQLGYPLVEGETVTLRVDASLLDDTGRPLRGAAERSFKVGPALRQRIHIDDWDCRVPSVETRDSLTVTFDRPLDRALLEHSLTIYDDRGWDVAGQALIGPSEESWTFEPDEPWRAGLYTLAISPRLEDIAGNSIARVFDRDLLAPPDAREPISRLSFRCGPTPSSR